MSRQESDFGTLETQQQGNGIDKGYTADGDKVGKIREQNHFDWMRNRHIIDDKQWQAGEYLRNDAYISGQFAFVKSSADFTIKGNIPDEPAYLVTKAKEKYKAAMKELSFDQARVINIYVIDDGYITEIKKSVQRKNMDALRDGLDVLVRFYGVCCAIKNL